MKSIEIRQYKNKDCEIIEDEANPIFSDIRDIKRQVYLSLNHREADKYEKMDESERLTYLQGFIWWLK